MRSIDKTVFFIIIEYLISTIDSLFKKQKKKKKICTKATKSKKSTPSNLNCRANHHLEKCLLIDMMKD
jgi:hypothetical protein